MKIHLLIINYNYSSFLLQNRDIIFQMSNILSNVIIVDDQSSEDTNELYRVFGKIIFRTRNIKSKFNSRNQTNAIYEGVSNLKDLNDDDYIWIMDADDVPIVNDFILNNGHKLNSDVFMFSRIEEGGIITPRKNHAFWITNVTTSCLIIRKSLLSKYEKLIKLNLFQSIWFDMRISCISLMKGVRLQIQDSVLVERVIHESNDSKEYLNNQTKIYSKIFKTLIYSLIIRW